MESFYSFLFSVNKSSEQLIHRMELVGTCDGTCVTLEASFSQPFDVMSTQTIVIPLCCTPTIISQGCKLLPRYLKVSGKRADVLLFSKSREVGGNLFTNRVHTE